jgi:hypothetical protein
VQICCLQTPQNLHSNASILFLNRFTFLEFEIRILEMQSQIQTGGTTHYCFRCLVPSLHFCFWYRNLSDSIPRSLRGLLSSSRNNTRANIFRKLGERPSTIESFQSSQTAIGVSETPYAMDPYTESALETAFPAVVSPGVEIRFQSLPGVNNALKEYFKTFDELLRGSVQRPPAGSGNDLSPLTAKYESVQKQFQSKIAEEVLKPLSELILKTFGAVKDITAANAMLPFATQTLSLNILEVKRLCKFVRKNMNLGKLLAIEKFHFESALTDSK